MVNRVNLLGLVLLFLLTSSVTAADGDKPAPTKIGKATSAIKIDGVLDEPAWQTATPVQVAYIWGKTGEATKQPTMQSRFVWDDDYLYIGYETFDKNLVAQGTGESDGPKTNRREGAHIAHPTEKVDVVEFFVSFGDERLFWELHHNAKNQFNDIWCTVVDDSAPIVKTTRGRFGILFGVHDFVDDDVDAGHTLLSAVKMKPRSDGQPSTINNPADEDTGYVGELRLPWSGLGGPTASETFQTVKSADANAPQKQLHGPWKMAGEQLLILSVFQDGDLENHYHHSSPGFPGGWFHKGSPQWPRYVLQGPPAQ